MSWGAVGSRSIVELVVVVVVVVLAVSMDVLFVTEDITTPPIQRLQNPNKSIPMGNRRKACDTTDKEDEDEEDDAVIATTPEPSLVAEDLIYLEPRQNWVLVERVSVLSKKWYSSTSLDFEGGQQDIGNDSICTIVSL